MSKFDQKSPKGSVPKGQSYFAMRYAIRWFKCKLKPPKNKYARNAAWEEIATGLDCEGLLSTLYSV